MCKKHHPESSSFSGKCGPLIYKYNLKPLQLAGTVLKYAALNLHDPPKDSPVARWFNEGQLTRNIGSVYTELYGTGFSKLALPKVYDGLFIVANSSASHLNKRGQRSPAPILIAPANLNFEKGIIGKPLAEWLVADQSTMFDFFVTTSDSNPYAGKQCAVINRQHDRHYGEMYGGLCQQIDASPYRGKSIRMRAAVRTDVSGQGNQAYLWLRVTKKSFGPSVLLFYDNMADHPITKSNWNEYVIVGKIPLDAEVIGYGLALPCLILSRLKRLKNDMNRL